MAHKFMSKRGKPVGSYSAGGARARELVRKYPDMRTAAITARCGISQRHAARLRANARESQQEQRA